MPIVVPKKLPAYNTLSEENVFVMAKIRANHQDIRPLKIAIVNLMPTKEVTETQLLRMLANTSLQVEIELLHMESHQSKNTGKDHLTSFYKTFEEVKNNRYDGMIITGAPVEDIPFEDVDYWDELATLMEFSKSQVFSTLHICWGAQAGLYYHYGIPKNILDEKIFGVFSHDVLEKTSKLMRGFDEEFNAPHSRHTESSKESIYDCKELKILAASDDAGPHVMATHDYRQVFIQGHAEYDKETLKKEYDRDIGKGMEIDIPKNYYKNNDPQNEPKITWRSHANLLFTNWLNYCVYQETPYDLNELPTKD